MKHDEGKELITKHLQSKGFDVIDTDTFDTRCQHDLEATKNGLTSWIEIKKRTCSSEEYGDVICELSKLDHLLSHTPSYLINIFTDAIYVVNVNFEHFEIQDHYCQKTAWYGGGKKPKKIISYKIENCKKLDI